MNAINNKRAKPPLRRLCGLGKADVMHAADLQLPLPAGLVEIAQVIRLPR